MRTFAALALFAVASAIHAPEGTETQVDAFEGETQGPSKNDVVDLVAACTWLAENVDWEPVKELSKTDVETEVMFQEIWGQIGDRDEVIDNEIDEDEARAMAKLCVEIDQVERETREAKGEVELEAKEFFAACAWLAENVSEETIENEDIDAAWEEVKDLPEAEGWTKEAAAEVAENCINLGKRIEEDEGDDFRPKRPAPKDGDDEDSQDDDEEGKPDKPEESNDAQRRRTA